MDNPSAFAHAKLKQAASKLNGRGSITKRLQAANKELRFVSDYELRPLQAFVLRMLHSADPDIKHLTSSRPLSNENEIVAAIRMLNHDVQSFGS